ncbi:hypothetical protein OC835_007596 [Tilletia horrida]|nr:hypothetical protein OC835_007596 [Tilletia horrida]
MPSTSSASASPATSSRARSHEQKRSSQDELIPLPTLKKRAAGDEDDEDEDDEDEDDDLIVHESQGLLGDGEDMSGATDGGFGDARGLGGGGIGAGVGKGKGGSRSRGQLKSLAINRAWRERHAWMYRHKYYRPLRLSFFVLLGVGAVALAVFSLRSALHVSSSHAPGSVSSSSHPPQNQSLLATTLRPEGMLSNGTHEWRRTVILISLDGVKPDYVRNYKLASVARIGLGDELFDVKHEPGPQDDDEEHEGAIIPGGIAVNHTTPEQDAAGKGGGKPAVIPPRPIPGIQPTVEIGHLLASSMLPIHPTLTFPNHWALLTGLYASSHGIVANDFHVQPRAGAGFKGVDPSAAASSAASGGSDSTANLASGRQFYYSDPARSWYAAWWLGEPVWATAERAGIPTAVHMWPGPPVTAAGDRPRYFREYEEGPGWDGVPARRVRDVLAWLGKPTVSTPDSAALGSAASTAASEVRPQLVCLYFPDVDKAAHKHGPDSAEVGTALASIDAAIAELRAGIQGMNATGVVDLIVVSDHGMASTSAPKTDRVVYLDRILGPELWAQIEHIDGYPSRGIRFKRPQLSQGWFFGLFGAASKEEVDDAEKALYERARARLEEERLRLMRASLGWSGPYHLYWREQLPEEWHLNDGGRMDGRLAPLWVVPTEGWGFTDEAEMKGWGGQFRPKGNHGYPLFDPFSAHPDPQALKRSMHAIFAASGPSFVPSRANPRVKLTHHTDAHVGWNMPVLGSFVDGGAAEGTGEGNGAASPAQGLGAVGTGKGKGRVDGAGTGAALRNLEVYELVCRLLGVPAVGRAPHNGTSGFWDNYVSGA